MSASEEAGAEIAPSVRAARAVHGRQHDAAKPCRHRAHRAAADGAAEAGRGRGGCEAEAGRAEIRERRRRCRTTCSTIAAIGAARSRRGDLPPPAPRRRLRRPASIRPTTGSTAQAALAYAAESETPAPARVRPMGSTMPRLPATATVMPASSNTTVVSKPPLTAAMSQIAGTPADPWLRAAMLTPSVSDYMTTTRLGRDRSAAAA